MRPSDTHEGAPLHGASARPSGQRPRVDPAVARPAARVSAVQAVLTRRLWPARLRPWLRAPGAHVLRELRDQRSILIGVFLALPVLTLLAFWAFADRLVEAPVDTAAGAMPPIALGLFLLAVVGDVFAGESRRGTLRFLRRLPGGMGHAFAAKLFVTLVGSTLTVVWQALLLWACWWLWMRSYVPTPGGVIHAALTSPFLLPVATIGAFVLLASTWLQHGGMAILLAPMLLGALVAPAVVWGQANPVLARWALGQKPWDVVLPVAVGVAGAAILAAAFSFLRGLHVVRSAWAAAWRGLAVLLVLAGGAYAYGAWQIHDALNFEPGDDGVRITKAYLGRGGRTLLLDAQHARGGEWYGGRTLSRAWAVDLEAGTSRALGRLCDPIQEPMHAGRWGRFPKSSGSLEPLSSYVQCYVGAEGVLFETWIDGAGGGIRKVVVAGVRTPDILAWTDQAAVEATRTRDSRGRRVWLHSSLSGRPGDPFGRPSLCVEGQDPRELGDVSLRLWQAYSHPAAWLVRRAGRTGIGSWAVVDPDDGTLRPLPHVFEAAGTPLVLSPTRCLWHGRPTRSGSWSEWHLVDLVDREDLGEVADDAPRDTSDELHHHPARGLQPLEADMVGVLDTDCVLTLAGDPGARVLCTWDPDTGVHTPLAWSTPWPTAGLPEEQASRLRYAGVAGYRGDGSVVLQVGWGNAEPSGHNPGGATGVSLITVDRETRTAACIVPLCGHYQEIVAYEQSGAVTVIEQRRRIVRWGPEPGQREVLFP